MLVAYRLCIARSLLHTIRHAKPKVLNYLP